jgi:hypothetical protein
VGSTRASGDASGLGTWIDTQRQAYRKPETDPTRLSADRIALLEQLPGWTWNALDEKWPSKYEALRAHLEANGGEYPAQGDAAGLYRWINTQRRRTRSRRLTPHACPPTASRSWSNCQGGRGTLKTKSGRPSTRR